jgi:protein-S-isoprenylcysteine O-methyltransferase Ste14
VTAAGELIRLWGVHHIGAISRTRSQRLGPLVATGPFALIRNPLYVGNI